LLFATMPTSSSPNVRFEYLYRDAGNYKKRGAVIFRGAEGSDLSALDSQIRQRLIDQTYFYPEKVGIPKLDLDELGHDDEMDVTWNEYLGLNFTSDGPSDRRTILEVIEEFQPLGGPSA
jgi:hypothetical protein